MEVKSRVLQTKLKELAFLMKQCMLDVTAPRLSPSQPRLNSNLLVVQMSLWVVPIEKEKLNELLDALDVWTTGVPRARTAESSPELKATFFEVTQLST